MKIEKKWKKLHKLLLCPLFVVFLVASVLVGNRVIVNADSLDFSDIRVNDYIPVAIANPDKISFVSDNTVGAIFGGNDVVAWSSTDPQLSFNDLGDDMELLGNSDNLADPPYQFKRIYNLGTGNGAFNHTHYLQNGRFLITLGTIIGQYGDYIEWVPTQIIFEKSDFIIKKADLMSCNITNYGVFPFIQFTNTDTVNGLYYEGISYGWEFNYSFLSNNGTWYPNNTFSVNRSLSSNYNYGVYLSPTDWTNGVGLSSLSDNDKIYIDHWRLVINFYNSNIFDSNGKELGFMQYTFPLIPNANHPDVSTYDLDYSDESFGTNYLTELVESVVGEEVQNNFTNWLLVGVNNFFGFEILPGVSLFTILAICLAIPLLIWILKLIMGG